MPSKQYEAWFTTTEKLGTCYADSEYEATRMFESWLGPGDALVSVSEVKPSKRRRVEWLEW